MNSKQIDLMSMNVTWFSKDLEVYKNQVGVVEATILTILIIIVLGMAVIAQRTFYRMMKRLPGRAINQILYPHMVRSTPNYLYISMLNFVMFIECFCTHKMPFFQVDPAFSWFLITYSQESNKWAVWNKWAGWTFFWKLIIEHDGINEQGGNFSEN